MLALFVRNKGTAGGVIGGACACGGKLGRAHYSLPGCG
jgi:hypothetical protein